jgi:CheY-like chemotaxis protein
MSARPVRFLLVEDDDSHAELVELALADNRIVNDFRRVSDGQAALAYLRGEAPYGEHPRPDVILLDLKLPKIDGLDVLRQVKNDPLLRTIPVVILTTSAAEVDRARAYEHHANSYVVKPIDFDQFHRMVKDLQLYWTAWNAPPPVI